jgi:hypothetical protein
MNNNSIAKWTALKALEPKAETKHTYWPWLAYFLCFFVGIVAIGRDLAEFANRHPWPIVCIVIGLIWLDILDMEGAPVLPRHPNASRLNGVKAPRAVISRRPMRPLDQGKEPDAPEL